MEATQEQGIPPSAEAFLKVAMESARAQRPIPNEPHPAYGIASIVPEMRPCNLPGRASLWSTEFQPLGLDWPGPRTEPELRVAMITHANALNILGGGEVQLFETVRALEPTGVSCSVGIGMIPPDGDLAHLFSLHHGGYTKELADQPYVLSPIYWDRAELAWIAPKILALAEHSETLAQLESGLAALNHQDQSLRDEGAFTSTLPEPVKALVRGAAMLLPNAKAEAEMLEASIGGPLPTVRVIPNGSPRPSSAEPGSSFEGLESGSFVLCVGRIEINKNQLALILACRQLNVPLVLIGAEPDAWYAALCRRVAGPRTKFMGSQPRGVALKAMRHAAVHVLPSFAETPGLANLEAISVGCPLICSTRGAEREYFGDAAQYVDPLDIHAMAEAIRFAMIGPKRKANWSPVTWQDVGLATSQAYRSVLGSRE